MSHCKRTVNQVLVAALDGVVFLDAVGPLCPSAPVFSFVIISRALYTNHLIYVALLFASRHLICFNYMSLEPSSFMPICVGCRQSEPSTCSNQPNRSTFSCHIPLFLFDCHLPAASECCVVLSSRFDLAMPQEIRPSCCRPAPTSVVNPLFSYVSTPLVFCNAFC